MSETIAELETAPSATDDKNDSMEELKFDDEDDEKNVSAEDILGGKSLLMSDSEQESSPIKRQRENAASEKVTVEEVLEPLAAKVANNDEEEEGEEPHLVNKKKKISALVDSDSEMEIEANAKTAAGQQMDKESREDEEEEHGNRKKKTLRLIDSDSEQGEDQPESEIATKKEKQKISALVDTESELEEAHSPKKAIKTKKAKLIDSDEEEDRKSEQKQKKSKKKKKKSKEAKSTELDSGSEEKAIKSAPKFSGLVDSESEQSDAPASDLERNYREDAQDEDENPGKQKEKKNKEKPMRASAKKAMDDMQAIQSEQQRLHREAHISVPYHQPKRHTLQEFLNRRTIFKPVDNLSPVAVAKTRPKHLKMTPDELEEYAKLMEERAKEATEFFKSDSEDEEVSPPNETENVMAEPDVDMEKADNISEHNIEMATKDDIDFMDVEPGVGDDVVIEEPKIDQTDEMPMETTTEINECVEPLTTNDDFNAPSENFHTHIDDEQPSTSAKCAIITEVVELPKLDMNTLNFSPTSKPLTPKPKPNEKLKELILAKSANVSPSIKGDANMIIDLETGDMFKKKPTGVDTLFERLLKTREARKEKESETVKILSTENGKLEISTVKIATHKETDPKKEQKPGAAYQQLKQSLKSIIDQKRLQKKKEEEMEQKKCLNEDGEEGDLETEDEEYEPESKPHKELEIDEDNESFVQVNEDEEIEEDIDEVDQIETDEFKNQLDDEEENDDIENEDADEEEEDESEETNKRKNRIICAFQDDSDEDDIDFLKTPKMTDPAPITATQLQLSATKLFDNEEKRSASDEENELLGLCSGKFGDTQTADNDLNSSAIISQMPMTQMRAGSMANAADELMELCSGTFETQKLPVCQPSDAVEEYRKKIISSDEEEEQADKEVKRERTKKLTKKMKKKKAKLGFSDDEDEDEAEVEFGSEGEVEYNDKGEEEDEEKINEDFPETFVDYDSEENEVVVELTKKDCVKRAGNFVQEEAELSESDWGSADEDEKNMDQYDIELGDEDEFDREKLRTELEQIHARKMLDKDIREVRQLQEMFIEDEEQDGVGRQRQFKWKNAEKGFALDDKRDENAEGNGEGSGDEENEHLWRKKRFEREQLLLEKGLKQDALTPSTIASPLSTTLANASAATTGGTPSGTIRKLNIITAKKTSVEVKKSSPFLISKSNTVLAIQQKKNCRGSFLVRDKETLTKIAGLTKGADAAGIVGAASVKSVKAKNFVFATLTEEEHENQKRKADDLLNSSTETGINYMKRPRMEPRREKCLIDQLL